MSFQHILAPLESLDVEVLEQAIQAAQRYPATLKLLHCVNTPIDPMGPNTVPITGFETGTLTSMADPQVTEQIVETQLADAQKWLEEYRQRAIAQGISATCEAKLGEPGPQICASASEGQIDLIVMGRKGHSGLTELLLGSVSNHVMHHAPCSVLVIQGKNHRRK